MGDRRTEAHVIAPGIAGMLRVCSRHRSSSWGYSFIIGIGLSLSAGAQGPFPMSAPVFGQFASLSPLGPTRAVADFNGDGREDIAAAYGSNLAVLLTSPGGGYGPPALVAFWPSVQDGLVHAATDLTGDGNADILCSFLFLPTASATTFVYPGNGSGQFGSPITVPDPSGFVGTAPFCFINRHVPGVTIPGGPPAIVMCSRQATPVCQVEVDTLSYQSNGYVVVGSLLVQAPQSSGSGAQFHFWQAADVNGDGLVDLIGTISAPPSLQLDWLLLLGTSSPPYFSAPTVVPAQVGLIYNFEVADVNNDGLCDVIARKPGANISISYQAIDVAVYFGHPTAPLTSMAVSVTGVASDPYTVVEDVDGDGNSDLILSISPLPTGPIVWPLAFSRGDGQGHFGPALILQSAPAISSPGCLAADADGDGLRDIVG